MLLLEEVLNFSRQVDSMIFIRQLNEIRFFFFFFFLYSIYEDIW